MGDGVKGQTFILSCLGMLFASQLSYFSIDGRRPLIPDKIRSQ